MVKFWGSKKLYAEFVLPHRGSAPLAPIIFKGQLHKASSGAVGKMGEGWEEGRKRERERQRSRR